MTAQRLFLTAALLCALAIGGTALADDEAPQPVPGAQGIQLNFKDVPLDVVLQYLSESTGVAVTTDVSVEGRVTVVSRQPLNKEEAIALLNSVLKEKGYAAVQVGRVLKILSLTDARKANIPVRSGSDPTAIQPSDTLITQVIPLRSVDASKLKDNLKALIADYADVSADASSNALIVTDTEANVRRIVEIVSSLDTAKSSVSEVKVFALKYADSDSAADLINKVFDVDATQSSQSSRMRFPFMQFRGGPRGGGSNDQSDSASRQQVKVIASSDDRTNTVVVSGPPETLKVVAEVIKELDSNPEDEEDILIYALKNADSANLEEVLTDLFEESDTNNTALRTTQGGRGGAGQPGSRGMGGATSASTASASTSDLAGQVRVVADEDTNSLMLMSAPKHFPKLRAILAELDQPRPQVLIKVLIAEVTHENDVDLGVEFSALNLRESGRGSEIFTDFAVAAQGDGLIYKLVEKDITVAVRALEEVGNLDILSRPYVLTSDNKEATITVGQEVPFITESRTSDDGDTVNTIDYEDIGIILTVTPHINPDGLVIMDVAPEISAISGVTVTTSETTEATVFSKRSASSRVAIHDGQTIVIGGLMEDRKTDTIKKVPVLGDVPFLGRLFRRTETKVSKTELLIFLTPHVAKDAEALKAISGRQEKNAKVVQEAVHPRRFQEAHGRNARSIGGVVIRKVFRNR